MSLFHVFYFTLLGGLALVAVASALGIVWLIATAPLKLTPQAGSYAASRTTSRAPSQTSSDEPRASGPSGFDDPFWVNPATGLPMMHGMHGVDVAGNPYGFDLSRNLVDDFDTYGTNDSAIESTAWHEPLASLGLDDDFTSSPSSIWDDSLGTDLSSGLDDSLGGSWDGGISHDA